MNQTDAILVVGEVIVDYTLAQKGTPSKLRLGGVVHAARGLWSAGLDYAVAGFCPEYVLGEVQKYLKACGCREFIWLGNVLGAPNLVIIGDVAEVADQGYEDLMRETRSVELFDPIPRIDAYRNAVVFPGRFDLDALSRAFSPEAKISFDVAYDVQDLSLLDSFKGRVGAIIISTSSPLFMLVGKDDVNALLKEVKKLSPSVLLLKENRGGSRLFEIADGTIHEIPALLGKTVNSVGVGDAYSAVMVGLSCRGWLEAAWRGCQVATAYSQSTFPDDIRMDVQRGFGLSLEAIQNLGGTVLPWHDRPLYSIYLAGPDFTYVDKKELDRAAESLVYHNFSVQRPVLINGELKRPASEHDLRQTYLLDYALLEKCDVVFAVPLDRDPGTLVEVGLAIAMGKPVVTFDPRQENENTMVVSGSSVYSSNLDACLNGTFDVIATLRAS
ncbi:nucleoside 2-deoxyribosyltransferase [[Pseudomonas] boreopolis]|uniref:nucleoside 2-deoxyribosyltransferase n=1 Tax=Xanthomonas boreopolis TaxID=86183 RepID=UPI003DA164F4